METSISERNCSPAWASVEPHPQIEIYHDNNTEIKKENCTHSESFPRPDVDVNLFLGLSDEAVDLLHCLALHWHNREAMEQNGGKDRRLKIGEEVAGTLAPAGHSERTELQPSFGVRTAWGKPVRIKAV